MSRLVFRVGASAQEIDRDILGQLHTAMALINAMEVEAVEPVRSYEFADWNVFFKMMTPNRIAMLEFIAKQGYVASVRALAVALGRDYRAVHADAGQMLRLGLLHRDSDGTTLRCESPAEATLIPA